MIRLIAQMLGRGACPLCDGKLSHHEAGFYVCACGVAVDYERWEWRMGRETNARPLRPVFAPRSHAA